jgi:uncharacterized protein YyaL (SSP411 family)
MKLSVVVLSLFLFALPVEAQLRKGLPSQEAISKLPADGGEEFNRLVFEQSPYLLQHARNPVDWFPWGEAAFEEARKLDKPIFLSVGYSTCHWCHVMEHESFEDEEVAELLNRYFVCVKVDREERPDVDQVYMTVTQAMTGSGGWPMTVMMTPERKPFFAATYIPKENRYGRRGMMEIVPLIGDAWRLQRVALEKDAETLVNQLVSRSSGSPGPALGQADLDSCYQQLAGSYDNVFGGFGAAPKFPRPHNLRFLLRHAARTGDQAGVDMVVLTLREMRKGGIWDHVGLGFARYSTDDKWLVPHFEKMLYDQALIAMAFVEAWQVTGHADLKRTAEEILTYVTREMTAPDGGFYSAEDADSEGIEGLFYLWTVPDLITALGEEDGAFAAALWNAKPQGNFKSEAEEVMPHANILHLRKEIAVIAKEQDVSVPQLEARIEKLRAKLFEVREPRIHPLKDDKQLTDWNGLMIAAFAMAGRAFDEPRWSMVAVRAGDNLLGKLRAKDGRLYKRSRLGSAGLTGMLEDYAFAVWGLLELYETSFDERYLTAAIELTDAALEHFWDEAGGGFYLSPDDGEQLIVRSKDIYDGAIPSGNSVFALNLLRISRITAKPDYEDRAAKIIRAFSGAVQRAPMGYTQLMLAVDFMVGPAFEIVVAGKRDAEDTHAMLRALAAKFLPNKVLLFRPTDEAEAAIVSIAEYTKAQVWREEKATAYVCQNFACKQPTTDIETMLESLDSTDQGSSSE